MNLFNWRVIKKYANKIFLVLIFVVGLSAASYILVYKPYSIRKDKEKFTKAEASLDEVYNQIVAKVGKPDEVKKDKNCAYANRVYGKGPRSCSVGIYLLYKNKNSSISSSIMTDVAPIIGSKKYVGPGERDQTNFVPVQQNKTQSFSQDYKQFGDIDCGIDYLYPVSPSNQNSAFQTTFDENLEITLICGGPAKAEHFTVKN